MGARRNEISAVLGRQGLAAVIDNAFLCLQVMFSGSRWRTVLGKWNLPRLVYEAVPLRADKLSLRTLGLVLLALTLEPAEAAHSTFADNGEFGKVLLVPN